MRNGIYPTTRDLHLYAGLFISPFVLLFALSVFALVHPTDAASDAAAKTARTVPNVYIAAGIEGLAGRARVDAVRETLERIGVHGEIGFVRHLVNEHRLIVPVSLPGRETCRDDFFRRSDLCARRMSAGVGTNSICGTCACILTLGCTFSSLFGSSA